MTWIQTYCGVKFDLARPEAEMVRIEDIAHALAQQCRFNGHLKEFYSIAEHSVRVAGQLTNEEPLVRFQGLLHDAAEAYVGDIVRPLKRIMPLASGIEERIWECIADRFEVPPALHPKVHEADNIMLVIEARSLMTVNLLNEWSGDLPEVPKEEVIDLTYTPKEAESLFLERFEELKEAAR